MDIKNLSLFDLHCDTPLKIYLGEEPTVCTEEITKFTKYTGCFAVWVRDDDPAPYNTARQMFNSFLNKNTLPIIKTAEDFCGKTSVVLTLEGGAATLGSTEILEEFFALGVRALTLTWNGENMLASGSDATGGLKPRGEEIIKKANELSMALDLSHINRRGFYDAMQSAEKIYVSHTACFDVFPHRRNITVQMAKEVAERGGIVGICFYPPFLGAGNVFENIYRHISLFLYEGLCDSIALGSDFDGADCDKKLAGPSHTADLYSFLLGKGIDRKTLNKIFFENAERFFRGIIK